MSFVRRCQEMVGFDEGREARAAKSFERFWRLAPISKRANFLETISMGRRGLRIDAFLRFPTQSLSIVVQH